MSNRPKRKTPTSAKVAAARGQSSARTIWIIVGAIVVVALAGVIAIAVSSSEEPASGDLSYGDVEVTGTPLPEMAQGSATDPAIGETIPTVAGVSFDDSPINIGPGGKAKIVMLLAHWCPHCQAEVPRIQDWLDDNGMPADVDLVSIATGTTSSRSKYPPGKWLREEQWSVPTLVDDEAGTAGAAFGLSSFPFFVVVDSSGEVVYRTSGELSVEQWGALVEAARTGTAPSGGGGQSSPAG